MSSINRKPLISLTAAGALIALLGACSSNREPARGGEVGASASFNASASANASGKSVSNERTGATRDDRATTVALSSELRHECQMPAAKDEAPQFDYDEAKLRPRGENILNDVASCLVDGSLKDRSITIVGRADPRGTEEHNAELGASRASAARDYLISRGVPADHIQMVSRGEQGARGDDEATWALDRRVDINIGSTAADRSAQVDSSPAATGGGPLVEATRKTVKREPDPKRAKGATYSDAVETGKDGPPKATAVPPRP